MEAKFLPFFLLLVAVLSYNGFSITTDAENITESTSPSNTSISEGKVRNVDISNSAYASTVWTGVYGNVTSEYIVGQSQKSAFFSWGLLDANYVYASSSEINFTADWQSASHSNMITQYPFLENSSEPALETFNTTTDLNSSFQSNNVSNTIAALTYDDTGTEYWPTVYLNDGTNGFFAGEIKEGKSFNGLKSDYQMILPEDGSNTAGTEYNLYLEVE